MEHSVYTRPDWRALTRESCVVATLFPQAAGPCAGLIHRHHVDPADPDSDSFEVCARHHPKVQAILRRLLAGPEVRRCGHRHRYDHARRECEARLNSVA